MQEEIKKIDFKRERGFDERGRVLGNRGQTPPPTPEAPLQEAAPDFGQRIINEGSKNTDFLFGKPSVHPTTDTEGNVFNSKSSQVLGGEMDDEDETSASRKMLLGV